ncbi:MAG TPA: hypothetical protein VI457_06840 [Methylococcaceae bacterium]|nr:hypothetical protein [Methylococcaceae bacterium]
MANEPKFEFVKLVYDEWKYRHDGYWKSLYRWCVAIATLLVIPFVQPEIVNKLQNATIIFPGIAVVMAAISFLQLKTEIGHVESLRKIYVLHHPEILDPSAHITEDRAIAVLRSMVGVLPAIIFCATVFLGFLEWSIISQHLIQDGGYISFTTYMIYVLTSACFTALLVYIVWKIR